MQYKYTVYTTFFSIPIILVSFLSIPFHQVRAQGLIWCDPLVGICTNPFGNVSTQPPANLNTSGYFAQQQQAMAQVQTLEQQYGITAYNTCSTQTNLTSCESGTTPSICPTAMKTCLTQNELTQAHECWLGGNAYWSPSSSTGPGTCKCVAGYQMNSGTCIAQQTAINALNFRPVGASCNTDGGWFPDNGACVSGNQTCADSFGTNTIYNGQVNNQGGATCDCVSGYEWNSLNTQCVAIIPTNTSNPSGAGLTSTQIQAILSLLSSFGADSSTIANVKAAMLGQ